jgi:BirA family biotin operon repressor/biotin-[acetyl-CoA-carboxylase] ligase
MDRAWRSSPDTSLTFSLALPLKPDNWLGLSLAVGVGLVEALQPPPSGSGLALGLKWPNDLWLVDSGWRVDKVSNQPAHGRKLGGVLIETLMVEGQRIVVVGVGLNVFPLPRLVAAELPDGVACLQELDPTITGPAALARVALPVVQALKLFEHDGFSAFAARYAEHDVLLEQPVNTTLASVSHGRARGVSSQGALLVENASGLHSVNSGDVRVRVIEPASEPAEVV